MEDSVINRIADERSALLKENAALLAACKLALDAVGWPIASERCQKAQVACNAAVKAAEGRG